MKWAYKKVKKTFLHCDKMLEEFVNKCKFCQLFAQKTTKHRIEPNRVPK